LQFYGKYNVGLTQLANRPTLQTMMSSMISMARQTSEANNDAVVLDFGNNINEDSKHGFIKYNVSLT